MLGSISEAEDALQEAWLRLSRSDTSRIENLGGWFTTVVELVCLDMLRSRRSRRDGPFGVHSPEPISSRARLRTIAARCALSGVSSSVNVGCSVDKEKRK